MDFTKKYFDFEQAVKQQRKLNWSPPDTPEPLIREAAPQGAFPVAALGSELEDLAQRISAAFTVPLNQVVHTLLACISFSTQHLYDLRVNNMKMPLSMYFFLIAKSGARVTSAASPMMNPIQGWQSDQMKDYRRAMAKHKKDVEVYKSKVRRLKKKIEGAKGDPGAEAELAKLAAPKAPYEPLVILTNPTIQGMELCLAEKHPSLLLFSTEAGALIGGYSMIEDNLINTIAKFSQLWDGKGYANVTATSGSSILYGKRLAVNLSAQKSIAEIFTGNPIIAEQGCLARFLISRITTEKTPRPYSEIEISKEKSYVAYSQKIGVLLSRNYCSDEPNSNSMTMTELRLSDRAFLAFRAYYDKIELLRCSDLNISHMDPFLSKAPEHMLRLAGVLSVYNNPDILEVSDQYVEQAITLVDWYIGELWAINDTGGTNPWLLQCDQLIHAIHKRKMKYVWPAWICSYGPPALREKNIAKKAVLTLIDYGHLVQAPQEINFKGKKVRNAYEVRLAHANSANGATAMPLQPDDVESTL